MLLPLSASLLSDTAHAQLTHNWLTHTLQAGAHSLSHRHSRTHTHTHEWLLTSGKEQIRRKAKPKGLLLRLRKHFAAFASSRSPPSPRECTQICCDLLLLLCCCFVVVVVLFLGVFHWTIFVERKRKKIFPRRSDCVCVCVCLPAIAHDTTTIRQSDTTVRQFVTSTMFLPKILFEGWLGGGGRGNKVKIEGRYELRLSSPRLDSTLLALSRLSSRRVSRFFYAEKGHCERPKNERSITNSSHLGLGLSLLLFPLSLPPSLSLCFVSFSLYLRLYLPLSLSMFFSEYLWTMKP